MARASGCCTSVALRCCRARAGAFYGRFRSLIRRESRYAPAHRSPNNALVIGIIGVLISAVGSIGASFCTTSWQMYLVFSIPVGIGFSCAFLPTLSLLGMWFKKRRGLATGIAVAGSGIGTIAIPPVAEYLSSNVRSRMPLAQLSAVGLYGTDTGGARSDGETRCAHSASSWLL